MASDQSDTVEAVLEDFEHHRAAGEVELHRFLPAADSPYFEEIRDELIRVDMEYSFEAGTPRRLAYYCEQFPDLQPASLHEIAFEEFRLRRLAGDNVDPAEYAEQYAVSVSGWPSISAGCDGDASVDALIEGVNSSDGLPRVGDRFLDYVLVDQLGEGTFGRVFLACQSDLSNRFVVLKISQIQSDEANRLARLQHTNIVPIHSQHVSGSLRAICMPFLGSTTLADVLRTIRDTGLPTTGEAFLSTTSARNDLTLGDGSRHISAELAADAMPAPLSRRPAIGTLTFTNSVLWVGARIADGLDHAHQRGICHRDLKPANVLLTDDGEPLILDFNLATDRQRRTLAESVGGTLPYMSPEQLLHLADATAPKPDERSDIYSLGVILFELLTGELPFPVRGGRHETAVRQMVEDREAEVASKLKKSVASAATVAIVQKCLEPRIELRYRSAAQLHEDITRHLDDRPLLHAREVSLRERLSKWRRRHQWVTSFTTLAIAAILITGLAVAGFVNRGSKLRMFEMQQSFRRFQDIAAQQTLQLTLGVKDEHVLAGVTANARDALRDFDQFLTPAGLRKLTVQMDGERGVFAKRLSARVLYLLAQAELSEFRLSRREPALDAARKHHQAAVAIAGHPEALRAQRAQIRQALGQSGDEWERAESIKGESVATLDGLLEGLRLLGSRQYLAAYQRFEASAEETPTHLLVWFSMGQSLLGLNEFARAEGAFDTCLAFSGQSAPARFQRGICRMQQKKWDRARSDFQLVADHPVLGTIANLNMALCWQAEKNYAKALESLDIALSRDQARPRALFVRAGIYRLMKRDARAEQDVERALLMQPVDELGWIARAVALIRRKSYDEALASLDRALEINPDSRSALNNQAHIRSELLGQPAGSLPALDRLVELYPSDMEIRATRGVVRARAAKSADALADARFVMASKTNDAKVIYRVACILALLSADQPALASQANMLVAESLKRQPSLIRLVAGDRDLDHLRQRSAFQEMVKQAESFYLSLGKKNLEN